MQFGQTDYRPALLKLAASKPDVLFVVITASMVTLADQRQADESRLSWSPAPPSWRIRPPSPMPPRTGFIHTQVQIDAPPELAARFKAKYGDDMDFFASQYYNARRHRDDRARPCARRRSRTSPAKTCAPRCSPIRKFQGIIPLEFTTNTAKMPIGINEMRGGKDVS